MVIPNERQLLPTVRDAVSGRASAISPLVDAIGPLFEQFIKGDQEKDIYRGWAFNLTFIKKAIVECEPYLSGIPTGSPEWLFFGEGKDDCTYAIPGKGVIKIHLLSFLWNK